MNPETIQDLIHFIEHMFPVGSPTDYNKSVTGEDYLELTNNGFHQEGELDVHFCETRQMAITCFLNQFLLYAVQLTFGTYKLYWRIKPELTETEQGCMVYARFLISDKPEVRFDSSINNENAIKVKA